MKVIKGGSMSQKAIYKSISDHYDKGKHGTVYYEVDDTGKESYLILEPDMVYFFLVRYN